MSDSNEGYDPVRAFQQRRQMYLTIQELQRLEHEAMKRISNATVTKKRELLEILSQWLMSQTTTNWKHQEAETLSNCSLQTWIM